MIEEYSNHKDAIDLNNGVVPKYHEQDCTQLIEIERKKLLKSKNEYIELHMGAKEALRLIK